MEIIQLQVLSNEEIREEVVNVSASLAQLREILTDTGFMSKIIDDTFDELITLLGDVVKDVEADARIKRKGR